MLFVDELAVLDGSKCILQLRGVRPFLSEKYDLTKHPNYHLTFDADKKNTFDERSNRTSDPRDRTWRRPRHLGRNQPSGRVWQRQSGREVLGHEAIYTQIKRE